MATELQPVVVHHGDQTGDRLLGDHQHMQGMPGAMPHTHAMPTYGSPQVVGAVPIVQAVPVVQAYPQQAGVVKPLRHSPLKTLIALFLLALAAILIGLLAYQAHTFFGGALMGFGGLNATEDNDDNDGFFGAWRRRNDDDDDATRNGVSVLGAGHVTNDGRSGGPWNDRASNHNVGFNGAGSGMFFFGILFAVLQAVTALTMWIHLAYYMPYLKHSSILAPLKVTAAVGFIAMGFASRHINLRAPEDTSETHHRVTHAIEAFIIINWFFVMLTLVLSLMSSNVCWDCENLEEHRITRRMTAGYTQTFLAIILIGLLAAYFQLYTERYLMITTATEIFLIFAIMFAVLQAISGIAMIQQCGFGAPGQMPETVHALLKVVIAFGIVAFGFACRTIYTGRRYDPVAPFADPHLVAIQSFVIINFIVSLYLSYASSHGVLNWDNYNTTIGERAKGFIFGILQLIFSVVLFGLLAGLLQGLTANDREFTDSINVAGKYMVWFGLLFAVLEFFAGCTMLESGIKKLSGLNPSTVSVINKVTLAIGALAFGFTCRHINLHERFEQDGSLPREPLVHAIEAFIILNFLLTWAIDFLCVKGKIEW